jgi:hypothetical protein
MSYALEDLSPAELEALKSQIERELVIRAKQQETLLAELYMVDAELAARR